MKKMTRTQLSSLAVVAVVAMVLSPVAASAAASSAGTTVTATVNPTISISTSSSVAFAITPVSGGAQSSSSDTVTVSTNNSTGYNLSLADADATTSLESGANSIAAHTGTFAAPTALANNSWGYHVDSVGGFTTTGTSLSNATSSTQEFAGVPASGSAQVLKTTGSTASGDTTTVWYSAKVDTSKPSGAYADSVTYTATTN